MKKLLLALLGFVALLCIANAQTTYQATNIPFTCDAATSRGDLPLNFGQFGCRGVSFGNGVELFFKNVTIVTNGTWSVEPFAYSLTSFTQPTPFSCPVRNHVSGCPAGTVPGTFAFTWSGTDANGVAHNGAVRGTWEDIQFCGGERCWYHPVLESVSLTINP